MTDAAVFMCGPGCKAGGQCDSDGPGEEGTRACAHCCGTGFEYNDAYEQTANECPRCKGTGEGGGFSTATCSKCGSRAIDRALWELP